MGTHQQLPSGSIEVRETGYHVAVSILPPVEVTGTLTLKDLTRFHYFHTNRRTWSISLLAILYFPVWAAAGFLLPAVRNAWPDYFSDTLPVTIGLLLWLFAATVLPRRSARRMFVSQPYLQEPITYTFAPRTISCSSQSTDWNVDWNSLQVVRETKSMYLLYTSPSAALIVPKRFFRSRMLLQDWLFLVHEFAPDHAIERPGVVASRC
jgi:hypothetical protein